MGRYHRQMLLPDWGEEGQAKLAAAHALLVGCGALGCSIADLLVRAGIGNLTIIDRDIVEITNLQRQCLFDESDVAQGLPKAEAARCRLLAVNSEVIVRAVIADFTPRNAERLARDSHLILDGTDNFETRYLLNDLSIKRGIPYVYGGAVGTHGMAMTVIPGVTPCLRCLFEDPPPPGAAATCDTAGVWGPVVAMVAATQAADAIRLVLGQPSAVGGTLLELDLWAHRHRRLDVSRSRRGDCPCCGLRRFDFFEGKGERGTESLCGQNAVQVAPPGESASVDLAALKARLDAHGVFQSIASLLIRGTLATDRGETGEAIGLTVFADGRAIIKGTQRPELARSIYARYIGA